MASRVLNACIMILCSISFVNDINSAVLIGSDYEMESSQAQGKDPILYVPKSYYEDLKNDSIPGSRDILLLDCFAIFEKEDPGRLYGFFKTNNDGNQVNITDTVFSVNNDFLGNKKVEKHHSFGKVCFGIDVENSKEEKLNFKLKIDKHIAYVKDSELFVKIAVKPISDKTTGKQMSFSLRPMKFECTERIVDDGDGGVKLSLKVSEMHGKYTFQYQGIATQGVISDVNSVHNIPFTRTNSGLMVAYSIVPNTPEVDQYYIDADSRYKKYIIDIYNKKNEVESMVKDTSEDNNAGRSECYSILESAGLEYKVEGRGVELTLKENQNMSIIAEAIVGCKKNIGLRDAYKLIVDSNNSEKINGNFVRQVRSLEVKTRNTVEVDGKNYDFSKMRVGLKIYIPNFP